MGTRPPSSETVAGAIAAAMRAAVQGLFREHPEQFYYCALITTGDGATPGLSAWSDEALKLAVGPNGSDELRQELKWSYADSPYCGYGAEHFARVRELFAERPRMDPDDADGWAVEWQWRIETMEYAVRMLDSEGLFGAGPARSRVFVNVEVVPPDSTNTERALRLNPPEALREWLAEASEEE
jgi:hypothetical protein